MNRYYTEWLDSQYTPNVINAVPINRQSFFTRMKNAVNNRIAEIKYLLLWDEGDEGL